jgi:hypothetical protein
LKQLRLTLVLTSLAAVALLGVGVAEAVAPPAKLPKPGTWEGKDGGGLTLTRGKGKQSDKLYASNVHGVTEVLENCSVTVPMTVVGKFPLKTFKINRANFAGVGKAEGLELLRVPAKVVFEGQTIDGEFNLSFAPNGIRASGFIEAGPCTARFGNAQHK